MSDERHGAFGYKNGCRCTTCNAWNRDRSRRQYKRKMEGRGGLSNRYPGSEVDIIDELIPSRAS